MRERLYPLDDVGAGLALLCCPNRSFIFLTGLAPLLALDRVRSMLIALDEDCSRREPLKPVGANPRPLLDSGAGIFIAPDPPAGELLSDANAPEFMRTIPLSFAAAIFAACALLRPASLMHLGQEFDPLKHPRWKHWLHCGHWTTVLSWKE